VFEGDEGLSDAADVHPVLRPHGLAGGRVGQARHHIGDLMPASGKDDHAWCAVRHHLVGGQLQPGWRLAGSRMPGDLMPGLGPRRDRIRRRPGGH